MARVRVAVLRVQLLRVAVLLVVVLRALVLWALRARSHALAAGLGLGLRDLNALSLSRSVCLVFLLVGEWPSVECAVLRVWGGPVVACARACRTGVEF